MEALKSNTEPYDLKSFGRKLDPEDNLKDRLIIRHLRQRKNNFLLDFDLPINVKKNFGANHE